MERWRWLPRELGERYVLINIATFQLGVYENDTVIQTHNIIVGRTYRQTPVFSNELKYLIINPWWEVPHNIARIDLLPKFQKNTKIISDLKYVVLDAKGSEIDGVKINWKHYSDTHFPFRLRQAPGDQNALGKVKFMFPNSHNVYIHDTPNKELFLDSNRTYSSGCIRVQHPFKLAQWVLKDKETWPMEKILTVANSDSETVVNLSKKIPVHFLYLTIDAVDNAVVFKADIYQRDEKLLHALTKSRENE